MQPETEQACVWAAGGGGEGRESLRSSNLCVLPIVRRQVDAARCSLITYRKPQQAQSTAVAALAAAYP